MSNRLWRHFEGGCNPYPLALFRMVFYAGVALHFFPSILWWSENYGPNAYRWQQWNAWLFNLLPELPGAVSALLAVLTVAGCVAGFVGAYPRLAATVTGLGCYVFASFNALNVQTLAISSAWAVFIVWAFAGGGDEVLSVRAYLKGKKASGPKSTRNLIVFQLLVGFTFAGIEKIAAGWLANNEMRLLLSSPEGFIMRGWIAGTDIARAPLVGWLLTILTVVIEAGMPIALYFKRTRTPAIIVYQLFFLGIIATMEVPPLFYCLYAGGMLLALDDATVARLLRMRNRRPQAMPGILHS